MQAKIEATKTCSQCGAVLPLEEFYKKTAKCKGCWKINRRAQYVEKREVIRAQHRKYYEENRQSFIDRAKQWRTENREQYLSWLTSYRQIDEIKDRLAESNRKWRETHQEERAAHSKLRLAIEHGDIARPDECSVCGASDVPIYGHHLDYSQPLSVEWVCPAHHSELHRRLLDGQA